MGVAVRYVYGVERWSLLRGTLLYIEVIVASIWTRALGRI